MTQTIQTVDTNIPPPALLIKPEPELSYRTARRLVSQINQQSSEVRALVLRLHTGRGWLALGHASWKACVEAEFHFDSRHAYRLLEAAQVERRVCPKGHTHLLPETHTRAIAIAPPARQREVYEQAMKSAPRGKFTAEHIRVTVELMGLAPNHWGKRATESNMKDYLEAMGKLTVVQLEAVLRKCFPSIPARVLFKAVDEARYMTSGELFEFNKGAWAV
jgi:hypothetical protein